MNDLDWKQWTKFQSALATLESEAYLETEEGSISRSLYDFRINYLSGELSLEAASPKKVKSRWRSFLKGIASKITDDARIAAWQGSLNGLNTQLAKEAKVDPGRKVAVLSHDAKAVKKVTSGVFTSLANVWELTTKHPEVIEKSLAGDGIRSEIVINTQTVVLDTKALTVTTSPFMQHRDIATSYDIQELIGIGNALFATTELYRQSLNRLNSTLKSATGEEMDTDDESGLDSYDDGLKRDALTIRFLTVALNLMVMEFERIVTTLMAESGT